jgi:hypothetical protein
MSERPFDSVSIRGERGTYSISTAAFLALPIHERIQHILSRRVDFFYGTEPVELRAALAWLRTVSASK